MPSVSVIIRCLDEEAHIGRLLTGITSQSLQADEIIVVDSGSTDATLDIASRFPVKIERIDPRSFSFGRSLNVGCRTASGDILVLASAHVYPIHDDWLQQLVSSFSDHRVAVAYGGQRGDDRSAYSERQIMRKWFPEESDHDQDNPFCNNANAAVRRSVWQENPYDEDLTGLEDLDFARRAMAAGHRVAYVAGATVVHTHDQSWAQIVNRYRREAIAHKAIFGEQRMGLTEAAGLALLNALSDWFHAAREGVLGRHFMSIAAFRTAQFWGTHRGFAQAGPVTASLKRRFYYPHGLHSPRAQTAAASATPIEYE